MVPTAPDESRSAAKGLAQLRPEDRESLISMLAQIMVFDYQQNQGVSGHTVEKPALFNRSQGEASATRKQD
jgi:hypothetical protein